jgi:Inhibitor of vertebrate lysozyme (Ivy)
MQVILLILLLALSGVPAFAVDAPTGPTLADLMKVPTERAAWFSMLAGQPLPPWIEDFANTLDGPPTPSIPIQSGDEIYTLAFTCKPNECGDNQLFVLFSPGGARAWGLLVTGTEKTGTEKKWLGDPDDSIKQAILSGLQ